MAQKNCLVCFGNWLQTMLKVLKTYCVAHSGNVGWGSKSNFEILLIKGGLQRDFVDLFGLFLHLTSESNFGMCHSGQV